MGSLPIGWLWGATSRRLVQKGWGGKPQSVAWNPGLRERSAEGEDSVQDCWWGGQLQAGNVTVEGRSHRHVLEVKPQALKKHLPKPHTSLHSIAQWYLWGYKEACGLGKQWCPKQSSRQKAKSLCSLHRWELLRLLGPWIPENHPGVSRFKY